MNHLSSFQEIIHLLALIGEHWRNKNYFLRQQAVLHAASEFCLSKPSFELAMDWIFTHWTEENIEHLLTVSRLPSLSKKPTFAIQILAGTTPAMIAQGFLQGALLKIPQCLKLPRRQTAFAHLVYQSFKNEAPKLANLFTLDDGQNLPAFHQQLHRADLVLAYGHDETIASIQKNLAPNAIFIPHGHAESAAIICKEAANIESLKKLAYDMLSYDQRGCLSPRVTFVERGGELSPAECAQQFAEIVLQHLSKKLPRGGLFDGEAAEILHQRALYGFRGKVYLGTDWTVCYDENLIWPTEALPRFMPFKAFNTLGELKKILPPLISIGYAGSVKKLTDLNFVTSRFCNLGGMQQQCLLY